MIFACLPGSEITLLLQWFNFNANYRKEFITEYHEHIFLYCILFGFHKFSQDIDQKIHFHL